MASKDALLPPDDFQGHTEEELAVAFRAKLKGIVLLVVIVTTYAALAWTAAPQGSLPTPSPWRAAGECTMALGMLMAIFIDFFKMPACTKDQDIFAIMKAAGKTSFLTSWILYVQSVHMVASAVAEVALFHGIPWPRLLTMSYSASMFVGTLGIMLTLLFLKFNYFEERWHKEVRSVWERRGVPFGRLTLMNHIPSLPIGLLDVALVRDPAFLQLCTPSLAQNAAIVIVFSSLYFAWMHLLWWLSGYHCWPYPFLHKFDTFLKRLGFLAGVVVGFFIVMVPLQLTTT